MAPKRRGSGGEGGDIRGGKRGKKWAPQVCRHLSCDPEKSRMITRVLCALLICAWACTALKTAAAQGQSKGPVIPTKSTGFLVSCVGGKEYLASREAIELISQVHLSFVFPRAPPRRHMTDSRAYLAQ